MYELLVLAPQALEVAAEVVEVAEERLERSRAQIEPLLVHVVLPLHGLLEDGPELGARPGRIGPTENRAYLGRRRESVALGELLAYGQLAGSDAFRKELAGCSRALPGPLRG